MKIIFLYLILIFCFGSIQAEDMPKNWREMNASKQNSLKWFNDAKYGMFIHWGIYSIPAGVYKGRKIEEMGRPQVAEWLQLVAQIPRDEYAKLANDFNPVDFDADQIAKLAKDACMKYLVITSKHHDGFALYDSNVSEFDIMDASPFKRDIIQELYDACKKHKIDFGLYYSHNIDWMDGNDCGYNEYLSTGLPLNQKAKNKLGVNEWDPSPNTFSEYLRNKAYPQVREIMTKYPGMKMLWYDMGHYLTPEQSLKFYEIPYDYQPQMLINGRVGNNYGDFDIPGDNKIPENHLLMKKPWQTVGTTNNSWGYKSYDNDWKSVKELLFWLVEIVSKGGNYMLNIGPKANGEVPVKSVNNLVEVGNWLKINGQAIYNTRSWKVTHEGPTQLKMNGTESREESGFKNAITPQDFWFTQTEDNVFVIGLEYPEGKVKIKSLSKEAVGKIKSVEMLGCKKKLTWEQNSDGLLVNIGKEVPDKNGYVLKIGI
jgi:alpha-L-fucosidase